MHAYHFYLIGCNIFVKRRFDIDRHKILNEKMCHNEKI